jgi:NAD(P)-dependent dehydrogenase (short-subunit alcohol dehydrogenase family)
MEINLTGKTALVTGGSSGIGESCVRTLRECGAKVAFTFHNSHENGATIARESGQREQLYKVAEEILGQGNNPAR